MAQPNDSPARVLRETAYTAARTAADPKTQTLSGALRTAGANHKAALDARNEADNAALDASAALDHAQQLVEDGCISLYRKFTASYDGETDPMVKTVFPRPAKTIVNATGKESALTVYRDILKRGQNRRVDPKLKPEVQKFAMLVSGLAEAGKAVTVADDALAEAVAAEHTARNASIVALRKARAKLSDLYADELRRVARFFLRPPKKKQATVKDLEKQLANLQKQMVEIQAKLDKLKTLQAASVTGKGGPRTK